MKVGYARVSTTDQHLDIQLAKLQAVGCEENFKEHRSGTSAARPALQECLMFLRRTDTLVITRLDRLARSTLHLCTIAEDLRQRGIQLLVIDQAIDTSTSSGVLHFQMLGAIAEFETALRRERQMEGIAHAKANGVHFGRKHALTTLQIATLRQRRAQGILIKVLMQEYRLSKAAIYRYLKHGQPQASAVEADAAD
jgi:DNA invertase Pin-like site-specific DNA recombinase